MSSDKSRKRLTAIALIAIIALLAINAILLYNKYKQDKIIHDKNEKIQEIQTMHSSLEKEYYEALSELEEMRGSNEDMNALIDQQKEELKAQRERIYVLIKDSDNLEAARVELNKMKRMVDDYIMRIEDLENKNAALMDSTANLRTEQQLLTERIARERQENDKLLNVKAALTEEKQNLEEVNLELEETVTRASTIGVQNIQVDGFKYGNSGKLRKRNKATNIELLKICFDAKANNIVKPGEEVFYLRLIDPLGETLAIENLGSGIIYNDYNNQQIRYTQMASVPYNKELQTICLSWEPNLPFSKGVYTAEVYNKGYLCGTSEFELK
jgi:hypothetical protein